MRLHARVVLAILNMFEKHASPAKPQSILSLAALTVISPFTDLKGAIKCDAVSMASMDAQLILKTHVTTVYVADPTVKTICIHEDADISSG